MSDVLPIAKLLTRCEINIGKVACLEVLSEKGSEKRARANALSARGLMDIEEGLGYWLADRTPVWRRSTRWAWASS